MDNLDADTIAKGLSEEQRGIALSLLGYAWNGDARPSPGIAIMNGLGLMHIDALKARDGSFIRYKAKPTELGAAVYALLKRSAERRVGNEWVSTCRSWWPPFHLKK